MKNIPIEVSARHAHLSQQDIDILFGKDYKLTKLKELSQPEEFACQETVDIKISGRENVLNKIRVVGPARNQTQVEISKTDAIFLKTSPPVRLSGDLEGSAPVRIIGPKGEIEIKEGLIIAQRHLHCATDEAQKMGLKDGDIISVKIESERPVIFEEIPVRVKDNYRLALHLDTDEGNATGMNGPAEGYIIAIINK